jgi:hypothetical protein
MLFLNNIEKACFIYAVDCYLKIARERVSITLLGLSVLMEAQCSSSTFDLTPSTLITL